MNIASQFRRNKSIKAVATFKGYDKRNKPHDGSLTEMKNMTGDAAGCISTRKKRGAVTITDNEIYNVCTTDIFANNKIVENAFIAHTENGINAFYYTGDTLTSTYLFNTLLFTTGENDFILSGGYLYLFPEMKYVNLMDGSDRGALEANISCLTGEDAENSRFYDVTFESCNSTGTTLEAGSGYVKITRRSCPYINGVKGELFRGYGFALNLAANDTVKISGCTKSSLNGTFTVEYVPTNGTYVVIRASETGVEDSGESVIIKRSLPKLDYVIACQNRLWGCRYGIGGDGKPVNEIYASALGDAKNWYQYLGASTDSFTASIGVDGVFTGACVYDGKPMFFKEDAVIRVFGTSPSDFTVVTSNIRGIEKGSSQSVAVVNDMLYYKSHSGIVAYDGGIPYNIDMALGDENFSAAVSGTVGGKYYVSMKNEQGKFQLFVYDTSSHLWYKEDDVEVHRFTRCGNELYMLCETANGRKIYSVNSSGNSTGETSVAWLCETGQFGLDVLGKKFINALEINMELESGARAAVEIEYDGSGVWQCAAVKSGSGDKITSFTVRPKRCNYFRLRFSGVGKCTIFSITRNEVPCGGTRM